MRTKLVVTIYKSSNVLRDVTTLIANHNEGKAHVELVDFIGLIHINRLTYPLTFQSVVAQKVGNKVMISDDNFTSYSLIVTLLEDSARELGDLSVDQNGFVTPKIN
ncbi:hypothetical protein UFOVP153_15 [uncultured Caudovirales phage]|uniref:Uncharacterized protein n=1 Tax=uncultured Caudovirales phage TaxID=2100421 RepID=A0A6J7W9R1_9CAUD|nr:hypothetical protein UFOVP69_43 [uncultured Caudovirales phage]CAB5170346.1 hypothetical protein UFOVP153_15 [uncultured Caudovirales phage]